MIIFKSCFDSGLEALKHNIALTPTQFLALRYYVRYLTEDGEWTKRIAIPDHLEVVDKEVPNLLTEPLRMTVVVLPSKKPVWIV